MHVRKFEANSMGEALKKVKREFGPDAIILKTSTNNGIKGIFNKSKVEITAAISEKDYIGKTKVDKVLDSSQKDKFYSNNSAYISNMIDNYSINHNTKASSEYGKTALNKMVKTIDNKNNDDHELDNFLGDSKPDTSKDSTNNQSYQDLSNDYKEDMRITHLENKILNLEYKIEKLQKQEPLGIYQVITHLRANKIDVKYLQELTKKLTFELSKEEQSNYETVFEFALKDMLDCIKIAEPAISNDDLKERAILMVFISEMSVGQTSMAYKVASLKEDVTIVKSQNSGDYLFSENYLKLKTVSAEENNQIISLSKKEISEGKSVIIDYKTNNQELDEVKNFVNGLRRGFDNIEVVITLSSLHSENYNRSILNKHNNISNSIAISNLDLCLDFGPLFNISQGFQSTPLQFYGTGPVIPNDLEVATAERLLGGIFRF